jgi:glucose-6-phosphate dehydrogenase assembly protein OpcA
MVTRFPDTPERVDVRSIEREVQRLWRAAADLPELSGRAGGPAVLTRICTLTLVVAAPQAAMVSRASDVVDRLIARYPCRSVVLGLGTDDGDTLDAWVSMHCDHADPARPRVCCEQITLRAGRRALSRVPGIVLPLLVPDLPVYLWWGGDLRVDGDAVTDVVRHLVEAADCLIVDSETMTRPLPMLSEAAALAAPLAGGLRDLTWGRLTPWRDAVAQSFDPPAMASALDRLERVAVTAEAADAGADPVAALLLVGWLASRLGWELLPGSVDRDEGGLGLIFRRTGTALRSDGRVSGTVSVEIRGGTGPVSAVECWAGGSEPAFVGLTRGASADGWVTIETRTGRGRPRRQTASFAVPDEVALLAAELDLAAPGPGFAGALGVAARIASGS